jgi:putative membrane protein
MHEYLSTLPNFLMYLGLSVVLLGVFMGLYLVITPQHELRLIHQGNISASVVLIGTLLGFALPVASAMAHSVALLDLALWGAVAGAVQLLTYLVLRMLIPDLRQQIETDRISVAILLAGLTLCMGLLNAAAMT